MIEKSVFNGSVGVLAVALLVTASCGEVPRESSLERNKRLVREMNDEVWNKGNLEIIDDIFSPDFVLHFLPDGTELRGVASMRESVRLHREAFPDWGENIQHIVAEGDLVVIHFVSTGTNSGSWLGNPPTGNQVQTNEVAILRIEEGRIAEQWLLPDLFGMRQQLGLDAP